MDSVSTDLVVTEIFHSIQGESTFAGRPCVFVRLTGCPLRCTWCDTEYAFHEGERYSQDAVVQRVVDYACPLVEVTGGEPLSQPASLPLMNRLCDEQFTVLLETSGALDIGPADPRVHIILDIKCPGSGMSDRMRWENLDTLTHKDEAKFVIGSRRDYEWALDVIARHRMAARCHVLFSPVFGALEAQTLAEWILEDRAPVRFQTQIHKLIWAPDLRGV